MGDHNHNQADTDDDAVGNACDRCAYDEHVPPPMPPKQKPKKPNTTRPPRRPTDIKSEPQEPSRVLKALHGMAQSLTDALKADDGDSGRHSV
jgi:hypothetical protein